MKEWIKEIKELYSAYIKVDGQTTKYTIAIGLASKIPRLIAEIESLEKEVQKFKEVRKEQLDITAQGEIECLQIEIEKLRAEKERT